MKKVLVVEDEASVRMMLNKLIREIGYIPVMADSGELALEIFKLNKDFDLIISDVVMEGMNGVDLVNRIRLTKNTKDIPVIVCSGMISKEEILEFLNAGISLFMEKPINSKKLQAHILKILEPALEETNFC